MRIAAARPEDVSAVFALERSIAEAPHWSVAEYAAIVAGTRDRHLRRCLLLAWRSEDLVGLAVGKVLQGEAELENIAVAEGARRAGAGRTLVSAVAAWCWNEGALRITLEVRAASIGAQRLYADRGFRTVGQRPGYYALPQDDAVLMELTRNSGCNAAKI